MRRLKAPAGLPLPSFGQLEASAAYGAVTTSMRAAWQVAVDGGLIGQGECDRVVRAQLAAIERELALGRASSDNRQTLAEMRDEYRE